LNRLQLHSWPAFLKQNARLIARHLCLAGLEVKLKITMIDVCSVPSNTRLNIMNACFLLRRLQRFETMIQEQVVNDFQAACNEERRAKEVKGWRERFC